MANRLKEGDLTDEKCRKLIVRRLSDIKTKLDSLARKDLLSSVNFLEEGVCLLNLSLDKSSNDEKKEDINQSVTSTTMMLSKAVNKLKIASDGALNLCLPNDLLRNPTQKQWKLSVTKL